MIRQRKRAMRNLHERRFICLTCGNLQDAPKVKGVTAPGHRKAMWCPVCKKKRLHEQVEPITMEDIDNMAKCMLCGKVKSVMNCVCSDCLPKREKRGRLPKAELDGMIEAERAYGAHDPCRTEEEREVLLEAWSERRRQMEDRIGYASFAVQGILSGILGSWGLAQDATNQEIYTLLRLLGWEVYEEQERRGATAASQNGGVSEEGLCPTEDMECDGVPTRDDREGDKDGTDL